MHGLTENSIFEAVGESQFDPSGVLPPHTLISV